MATHALSSEFSSTSASRSIAAPISYAAEAQSLQKELQRWFRVEFTIVDSLAGELLLAGPPLATDLAVLGPICREVNQRQRSEFIQEEEPVILLAVPLH